MILLDLIIDVFFLFVDGFLRIGCWLMIINGYWFLVNFVWLDCKLCVSLLFFILCVCYLEFKMG